MCDMICCERDLSWISEDRARGQRLVNEIKLHDSSCCSPAPDGPRLEHPCNHNLQALLLRGGEDLVSCNQNGMMQRQAPISIVQDGHNNHEKILRTPWVEPQFLAKETLRKSQVSPKEIRIRSIREFIRVTLFSQEKP